MPYYDIARKTCNIIKVDQVEYIQATAIQGYTMICSQDAFILKTVCLSFVFLLNLNS